MGKVNEVIYMNRNQVAEIVKHFPVAVLPVGSTEQHGPHLPLGSDSFLAEGISRKVCEKTGALLLPTIPFGYSWVWRNIPGTVTLEQDVLETVVKNAAHSVARYGIKLLIIINGHGANDSAMKYATRELMDEIDMTVIYLCYPGLDKIMEEYCESPSWHGMVHACEFETSLMLVFKPELVNMNLAVREYPDKPNLYGKSTISIGDLSKSGVYGDPTLATKEKGEKMLQVLVDNMTNDVLEAYNSVTR